MIIPILCQSCGRPIGHQWFEYLSKVKEYRSKEDDKGSSLHQNVMTETPEFKALRDLNIERDCCRIAFMCTVDLSDVIS